jgi:hypothetical protein
MLKMEADMADTTLEIEKPGVTGKAKAKADAAITLADKRKAKRARLAEANKITFLLETEVRKFVTAEAKAAGMDIAPFMQKIVETHVLANAPKDSPLARRLAAKRAVLDHVVALAHQIDSDGGFDEHFILNVTKQASADAGFQSLYATATGADDADDKAAARGRAPINQQLGRLIKRAAGARSKRDTTGKIMRAQVQGELISAYTLLDRTG